MLKFKNNYFMKSAETVIFRNARIVALFLNLKIIMHNIIYNNSKKYQEFRENRDAMVIIPIEMEMFHNKNTKNSKNDIKR